MSEQLSPHLRELFLGQFGQVSELDNSDYRINYNPDEGYACFVEKDHTGDPEDTIEYKLLNLAQKVVARRELGFWGTGKERHLFHNEVSFRQGNTITRYEIQLDYDFKSGDNKIEGVDIFLFHTEGTEEEIDLGRVYYEETGRLETVIIPHGELSELIEERKAKKKHPRGFGFVLPGLPTYLPEIKFDMQEDLSIKLSENGMSQPSLGIITSGEEISPQETYPYAYQAILTPQQGIFRKINKQNGLIWQITTLGNIDGLELNGVIISSQWPSVIQNYPVSITVDN